MSFIGNRPDGFGYTSSSNDHFSGDGANTVFTLTRSVTSNSDIQVVVNNVVQDPGVAYYVTNLNQLNFTGAPSAGTNNIYVVYRDYVQSIAAVAANSVTTTAIAANTIQPWHLASGLFSPVVDVFTANGSGSTFVLSQNVTSSDSCTVTVNGVVQSYPTNFSAVGNILTFTSAPANNSIIRCSRQSMFSTGVVPLDNSVTSSKLAPDLTILNSANVATSNGSIRMLDIITGTPTTDSGILFTGGGNTVSGIFTEVSGNILSYGINCDQITSRDLSKPAGIFRLDTRNGPLGDANCFVIKATSANSVTEFNVFIADLNTGNTHITPERGVANVMGQMVVANTTASTSNVTGALVVSGGIGTSGNVISSQYITATSPLSSTVTSLWSDAAGPVIGFGGNTSNPFSYMKIGAYSNLNNIDNGTRDFRIGSTAVTNILYANNSTGSVNFGGTGYAGLNVGAQKNMTGSVSTYGISSWGFVQSDSTNQANYFHSNAATAAASFTVSNLRHYYAYQGTIGAGSTVSNQYGFVAENTLTGATNNYGFLSAIPSGTGRYNFYASGTADNYFAGAVFVGGTLGGDTKFAIGGTLPSGGSSSFANRVVVTAPSASTSVAVGFDTSISTTAASYTLDTLIHHNASQGTIGAGSTVTSQRGFSAQATLTGATNNFGFYSNIASGTGRYNFYAAGTADNYFAGNVGIGSTPPVNSHLAVRGTHISSSGFAQAIYATGSVDSSTTTRAEGVLSTIGTTAASFTCNALSQYYAGQGSFGAGSTVTNQYGYVADSTLTGATNNYGFYSNIASGTGRWNFYAAGTAANYFAGAVGIGTIPVAGYRTLSSGSWTGATTYYGVASQGTCQSDVTGTCFAYRSAPNTAAVAFTLGNIIHFGAENPIIGAGSTVTNQYGHWASSGLTGATNNFGFYSNIASGTGRYNFYSAGTADNYFAGVIMSGNYAEVTTNSTAGTGLRIKTPSGSASAAILQFTNNPVNAQWAAITSPSANILTFNDGGSVERARFDASGHFIPGSDVTYNLGSTTKRWANIYTGDLHLSNESSDGNTVDGTTGNWTLQEGEEHLYIINNKTGKKFRFKIEEIV